MTRTLNKINNEYILYASRGQALSLFVALKSIKTPFVIDSSVVLSGKLYTSITSYVEYDLNLSLIDGGIRISLNEFETALLTKSYYMFSVYMQKGLNKVDVISGIINIINNPSDEIDSENMIATHTTDGLLSRTDKVKLDSIAYDASHNSSDEYLLSRENHTGTQPIDTIEGLVDALSLGVGVVGTKGDKGDKGDTGEQGLQGIQGEPGEAGLNTLQTLDASVAIPSINLRSGTLVNITQITGNFTMPTIDVNPVLPVNEGILGSIILNWVVGAVGSQTVIVGADNYVVNDVSKGFKLDYVVVGSEILFEEVDGATSGDVSQSGTNVFTGDNTFVKTPQSARVTQTYASSFTLNGTNPINILSVSGGGIITFNAVSNMPAVGTVELEVVESGAGNTVAWNPAVFEAVGGTFPTLTGTNGAVHLWTFRPMADGKVFVGFARDIK